MQPRYGALLQAAVLGFGSAHWEVRNAAGLAFGAALERCVGFRNAPRLEAVASAKKATTGAEFFSRFPSLHAFLLAELQQAVAALSDAAAPPPAQAEAHLWGGGLHPSLFPVLALLARLRPAPTGAAAALAPRSLASAAFERPLRAAGGAASYAVRALAARALAPLVDAAAAPALAAAILEPPGGAGTRPPANVAHGALLQAAALLRAGGGTPAAVALREAVREALQTHWAWLPRAAASAPAPLLAELLQVYCPLALTLPTI